MRTSRLIVHREPSVVVTGAAGRIGRAVVDEFLGRGFDVVGLDRSPSPGRSEARGWRYIQAAATDMESLKSALAGRESVVHLAATPSPLLSPAVDLFVGNTSATMTVLTAAAEAGVRAAVIASSISILGLVYAHRELSPAYAPVDERTPLQVSDAYALSKQCDEATALMINRRYGLPVAALRFPFTATAGEIGNRAALMARDPAAGRRELWAYLDVRDAAGACVDVIGAQLDGRLDGAVAYNVIADDSLADQPLDVLLARFHPSTQIREGPGRMRCAYDTTAARTAFGFHARHIRSRPTE